MRLWAVHRTERRLILQWDRAFDSAEWLPVENIVAGLTLLQWDRAFDSAECRESALDFRKDLILQWDRAFDSAECNFG